MKRFATLIFLLAVIVISFVLAELQSCHLDPVGIDKLKAVCFNTEILPIFKNSCGISGCHDGVNRKVFVATSYESIMKDVKPGNAKGSLVYKVLGRAYGKIMPPNRQLPIEQRMLIEIWIQQGAQNTTCDTAQIPGPGPVTNKDTICFTQNILPILTSSCGITGCHDAASHRGGYVLINYTTLTQHQGDIVPFNPNSSHIYQVTTTGGEEGIMPPPPKSPLTSQQTETFRKWIAQGASNSDCPLLSCDTTGTILFSTQVWPIVQNSCLGCHNGTSPSGGVNLSNYQNVKVYADNIRNGIPVIDGAISQMTGFFAMPPSGKLDKCLIRKIELWIQQGKLNN